MKIAVLSYDSPEVMRSFAQRRHITYPLLADPGSENIRRIGVLNENYKKDDLRYDGVPFPGTFLLDRNGKVTAKHFEDEHHERFTAASLLVRHFGDVDGARTEAETQHLRVSYTATNAVVSVGTRITLVVDVKMNPGMHVYAPSVSKGYIPIEWTMEESKAWLARPVEFPPARTMRVRSLNETFPVYSGSFRLIRDFTVGEIFEHRQVLAEDGSLSVRATLRYQACDVRQCYPPRSIPLAWTFATQAHDQVRVDEQLQIENIRRAKKNRKK